MSTVDLLNQGPCIFRQIVTAFIISTYHEKAQSLPESSMLQDYGNLGMIDPTYGDHSTIPTNVTVPQYIRICDT